MKIETPYVFLFISLISTVSFAQEVQGPRNEWDYQTMRDYVARTPFFDSKPCIVFRDIWDAKWVDKVKAFDDAIAKYAKAKAQALAGKKVKIPTLRVDPQTLEEINTITLHHAEFFEGSGPEDIKRMHVTENGWSDIGYHYVIAKKTPPETFFTRVMIRRIASQMKSKGYSNKLIKHIFNDHLHDFRARREIFVRHRELALKDPRNEGCVPGGENWLVYEARAERFQGAHAGGVTLRFDKESGLFQAISVHKGHLHEMKFFQDGDSVKAGLDKNLQAVLEDVGFIQGAFYRMNTEDSTLELVDASGTPSMHPVVGKSQKLSIKGREKIFQVKDDQLVKLNYNPGSIGVVIAGSYHEHEEAIPFGYYESAPEWLRQPDQEAVRLIGQLTNSINQRAPVDKMLAHRSGTLAEKHNCSGGSCPGEGAIEVLRAINKRFYN